MKKFLSVMITAALMLSVCTLTACNDNKNQNSDVSNTETASPASQATEESSKEEVTDISVAEEKTFTDYKLVEVPENKEGTLTKKPVIVKYYYAHDSAGVIVHYIDEQTNKEIIESVIIPGQEGDTYEAEAKTIDNYAPSFFKTFAPKQAR